MVLASIRHVLLTVAAAMFSRANHIAADVQSSVLCELLHHHCDHCAVQASEPHCSCDDQSRLLSEVQVESLVFGCFQGESLVFRDASTLDAPKFTRVIKKHKKIQVKTLLNFGR